LVNWFLASHVSGALVVLKWEPLMKQVSQTGLSESPFAKISNNKF
jgi:hypothetical protein